MLTLETNIEVHACIALRKVDTVISLPADFCHIIFVDNIKDDRCLSGSTVLKT